MGKICYTDPIRMAVLKARLGLLNSLGALLLLLASLGQVVAQDNSTVAPRLQAFTNATTIFNPSKLTPIVGLEANIWKRFNLELGLGYTLYSSIFASDKGEAYRGLLFQPAIKFYTNKKGATSYTYLALENRTQTIRHLYLTRFQMQGGSYEQISLADRRVQLDVYALRLGKQLPLNDAKRWWIEMYVGAGIRNGDTSEQPTLPASLGPVARGSDSNAFFSLRLPLGKSTGTAILGGFKIYYRLR